MPKKLCGNCFSIMRGNICRECGYALRYTKDEYDALSVGTRLNGRYTVGRVLGRGGFGITYLAYDESSGKSVAVKEFYPDETAVRVQDNMTVEPITSQHAQSYSVGLERFMKEAEIIARFNESTEILGVYDVFRANGTAYYAMEFVKGVSLKSYVETNGAITEGQAVCMAKKLLPALAVIHRADTLHRDVCPDNIMLCANGSIKLIDFGSARVMEDRSQSMSVIIKPGFAPLEQYQRRGKQDGRTDLYSLGASLYFGLTREIPEDPLTRLENDDVFSEKLLNISDSLAQIIKRSASVRTENRYSGAEEMLEEINGCGIKAENFSSEKIYGKGIHSEQKVSKPYIKRKTLISSAASLLSRLFDSEQIRVRIGGDMYPIDLTMLDLSDRELTNTKVSNLRHLKKLKYLNLNNNYITDLSCLEGLTELEVLHFNHNNITDLGFMREMMKLKHISAENTGVSDISVLADKTELECIYIGDSYVADIMPLNNCSKLREAGMNELQIGSLEALRGMKRLEKICLAGCGLFDISPLSDSKWLKYVYLGRNKLSDLSPLSGCTIEELYIDNNRLSGHIETFRGITLNGFASIEGNGFSDAEIEQIRQILHGSFELHNGY